MIKIKKREIMIKIKETDKKSFTQDFSSLSYGKWILTGEHSVLRGGPALVFPLYSRSMKFLYRKISSPFQLKYKGVENELFYELFMSLLDRVKSYLKVSSTFSFQGELMIENNIPIGEGLGASAAFCVNMARWLHFLGFLKEDELFSFAKNLEDLFHGESSGIDIAVALEGKALRFERSKNFYSPLKMKWNPFFYLSHSGKKSLTSHCVQSVKKFIKKDPVSGNAIDQLMKKSTTLAEEALEMERSDESLEKLSEALKLSKTCFQKWGLMNGSLDRKMQDLLLSGALAVKPTGSGSGGFILSLWKDNPNKKYLDFLIPCYKDSSLKHFSNSSLESHIEV